MAERQLGEVEVVLPEEVVADENGLPDQLRGDQDEPENHDATVAGPRAELRPVDDVRDLAAPVRDRQGPRRPLREGLAALLLSASLIHGGQPNGESGSLLLKSSTKGSAAH